MNVSLKASVEITKEEIENVVGNVQWDTDDELFDSIVDCMEFNIENGSYDADRINEDDEYADEFIKSCYEERLEYWKNDCKETVESVWVRFKKECDERIRKFAMILEEYWEGMSLDNLNDLNSLRNGSDGYTGFIWYDDTKEFYHRNKATIIAYMKEVYNELGYHSMLDMIFGFNGIRGNYTEEEICQTLYTDNEVEGVADCLAKLVLEEVAQSFQCFIMDNDIDLEDCEEK